MRTLYHIVFDLHGTERLAEWKQLRNNLEHSQTPFEDVMEVWKMAPFVSPFLDPTDPKSWPDPWRLIIDGKFDSLAICLGILYTIKLTERFIDSSFEIHMSMSEKEKDFYLCVDGNFLDLFSGIVKKELEIKTNIIWQENSLL